MNNSKSRRSFGLVLIGLAVILSLFFKFGLRYIANPEVFLKEIQNSIIKAEFEINSCSKNTLDYSQYGDKGLGLFVYSNDSLVYWNSNIVGPKMIRRRVPLGCDTVCNLQCGDFLVRSFTDEGLSFYVFKLLNPTYSIENKYFENRFWLFPFILDVDLKFDAHSNSGYPIYNVDNDLLTYCEITPNATIRKSMKFGILVIIFLLLIVGLVLLLLSFKKVKLALAKFRDKEHSKFFEFGILVILLLSILLTYLFYNISTHRENESMIETANSLIEKRDAAFEQSFYEIEQKMLVDSTLREMIFSESNIIADLVLGYTQELVFDENLKSYTTSLTVCSAGEEITIQPDGFVVDCESYFADMLSTYPNEKVGDDLYFIDYYSLDPSYLGIINVTSLDNNCQRTLYFEFYKPIAPIGFGYPKMLQNGNSPIASDYSVARYNDTLLVYKNGRYFFPSFLGDLNVEDNQYQIVNKSKLYAVKYNDNDVLVISVPRKSWSEITAPFGVIFLILLLPLALFYLLLHKKSTQKHSSLRKKLQVMVISTLFVSFCAVGPISVIYMRTMYNKNTKTNHFETIRTLSLEMQKDLDFQQLFASNSRETWAQILHQYASTFFTDVNLYGLDGRLIATTREEVYEHYLQGPIMNAEAFEHMNGNRSLYYVHDEMLGLGVYESAYVPITDRDGNTLSYLNTPFFSSKADLKREIVSFVLTYVNIILLLLGLALFFVLTITRRLTQPLGLIQNKMREVKIDRPNEAIEWHSNDEIGALVKQYNELVQKLEQSAADLQRTTTESAWRGVARQVAHEIKNSLTPMRLSLQMLQRSVDNGADNLDERIKKTSDTLIEQIDALCDIASSFSSYAKLPENDPKPLNLAELIGNVVNLYDSTENIEFTYTFDPEQKHTFNGDKTNLNSAFGNIIKNAVQAIGSKPDGKIDVNLVANDQKFLISIKDNGRGIKEEDKKQVFLPNFTTKSGGSGVGLSLTYNIIQSAGGRITFESTEGEGTEFVIELFKKDSV